MVIAVAGSMTASSSAAPGPDELPPNVIALVIEMPARRGTITVASFQHELELQAVQKGRRSAPSPGPEEYAGLRKSAIDWLLEGVWIRGQAIEWGISLSHNEIKRELALIKRESFKSGAEYRRFLRENHYSRRDIFERVEIQLLSTRLQRRFEKQIGKQTESKSERRRAFNELLREFSERWRARTVCAPEYATERCSNGPPPAR
jgi:hypothetical protein